MAMGVDRKPRGGIQRLFLLGVGMGCVVFPAFAGDWKITPTIAVMETATDNVALSNTQKQSDLISDINPGILIDGSGGRSKLHFDYQLHDLIYAQNSARNNTQNSLNAFGTLEALENWLFIDASGFISQQSISAFGGAPSSAVNTNVNSNLTETSTYRISPYVRGTLGSAADYQLRYSQSTTHTNTSSAFNSNINELIATLKGVTALTNLGWSLDASGKTVKFENGVSNDDDRVRGVLAYALDPQFRVSLIGGREANNYLSVNKEGHTITGAGFEWAPTERTQIAASRESRFFGNSNSVSFSHRTAGTAWRYSESKDATVQPNQQSSAGPGVYNALAYTYCQSLEGTSSPSLSCVTGLASALMANVPGGFLTSGVTLQHRRELSFAVLGVRNTVTFGATQTESEALSQKTGTGFLSALGLANLQDIRQRGASISWANKLSGLSSLTGSFSRMVSTGTGTTTLEMVQKMLNLSFLTQLGPKTYSSLGARRVVVDGTTTYSENALLFTLSHQF